MAQTDTSRSPIPAGRDPGPWRSGLLAEYRQPVRRQKL